MFNINQPLMQNRSMLYVTALQDNVTNSTEYEPYSGSVIWFTINSIIITVTVLGNLLTISAIVFSRKLNSVVANQFVFSLAVSDLFVGFTVPYHMAFYTVKNFGSGRLNCLLRFVLISFACSSSISNLLFIATDRYVAIVYPLHYARIITRKSSFWLTIFGWTLSFSIAAIPLTWNDWHDGIKCEIVDVLPNSYINFIVCPMFVLIWLIMLLLYSRICSEAAGHAKRMRTANSTQNILTLRDSKSFQVMLTILGCFTICWLPYFVIVIYARYNKATKSACFYEIAFTLAVSNSGMNPIIYAWKNHNFRASFLQLIRCKSPNSHPDAQFVTNHIPSKKNSISNGACNAVCVDETCASICDNLELTGVEIDETTGGENGTAGSIKNGIRTNGSTVDTVWNDTVEEHE